MISFESLKPIDSVVQDFDSILKELKLDNILTINENEKNRATIVPNSKKMIAYVPNVETIVFSPDKGFSWEINGEALIFFDDSPNTKAQEDFEIGLKKITILVNDLHLVDNLIIRNNFD
ncbi:MAG: hypothetical protein N2560_08300 [Ignavibacteria bacterium]|nr:hypothetical protein [Ignavibacteria bacterium]